MVLAIRIEIILITALFVVASDHGNFLFKKSLIKAFPAPKRNEYIIEMTTVIKKFSSVLSLVRAKKKKSEVPSEIQSNIIKSVRFMMQFSDSKIIQILSDKNYFLPNGAFL